MRMITRAGSRLITPHALESADIQSRDGEKIGSISTIVVNEESGKIEYFLVGSGGVLGIGEKFVPVPWDKLTRAPEEAAYVADFTKEQMEAAPAYDRDQLRSSAYAWDEQVRRHFGSSGQQSAPESGGPKDDREAPRPPFPPADLVSHASH